MGKKPVAFWAIISTILALLLGFSFYLLNHREWGQSAGWMLLFSLAALAVTGTLTLYYWFMEMLTPYFLGRGAEGLFSGRTGAQLASLFLAALGWGIAFYLISMR